MDSGAIDWNICPLVIPRTSWPSAIEPLVIHRNKGQMFQSIAPATIK